MKTLIILFLFALLNLNAAMISFQMTNSVTLLPDTNVIKVFDCGPVMADGTVYTTGVGRRVQPDTNGYAVISLPQNNYLATNAYLGRGYIFRAPLDSSTNNIYQSAGASCLISGLNYFVNLVVGDATNQAVTLNQITNATGFPLLSPTQITNIAQAVTNGFTSIVYSNPASFASAQTVTGIVQSLSPSFAQSTNIAQQQASNIVSGYTTTGSFLSASNYLATNSYAQTLVQGLSGTNFTLLTSNSVYTNLQGQLLASSNALQSFMAASNAVLVSSIGSTSNALWLGKQPASGVLSNLAVTGAFTNSLAAGTNISLSTNLTAPIVYVNATLQTQLTNGFTSIVFSNPSAFLLASQASGLTNGFVGISVTNGLATLQALTNYAYPIGNPSNFVTGSITNGLVSSSITNSLATLQAMTNYAYPISNPSNFVTASITNGLVGPSITNGLVTASITNGFATTNWVAQNFQTNGLIIPSTNGFVTASITNGFATTNYVITYSDTNGAAQAAFSSATNDAAGKYLTQANGQAFNLAATNQFSLGSATNFLVSTNLIGVSGAGSSMANGTYQYDHSGFANTWTNTFSTNATVLYSGGNYYIQSNGVSLYSSTSVNSGWTLVNGVNPIPAVAYGSYWDMNGVSVLGFVYSTNLVWQATNIIAQSPLSGVVGGIVSSNTFSALATNIINALALAQAISYTTNFSSPTNGINAAQATNIVLNYGGTLFQTIGNYQPASANLTNWASLDTNVLSAYTNSGSVKWGDTTNLTVLARPATLYYFVTNGMPQYGILNTN